jgi:hypothetical protein
LRGGVPEELFDVGAKGFDEFAGAGLLLLGEDGTGHGFQTAFASGLCAEYRFLPLVYKEPTNCGDAHTDARFPLLFRCHRRADGPS